MRSSAVHRDVLESHYRQTSFWVDQQDLSIRLRVGEHNPLLDDLLERYSATNWAYITAFNPGSILLSAEENDRRQRELRSAVEELGHTVHFGRGIGDCAVWPAEQSIFVVGINKSQASTLGIKFGQNSIVVGEKGGVPELCSFDVE